MTQTEKKVVNLKRMKNLFLEFLKQFEVDEYKLLMQFLQLIVNKYNSKPANLIGFLTDQIKENNNETSITDEKNDENHETNSKSGSTSLRKETNPQNFNINKTSKINEYQPKEVNSEVNRIEEANIVGLTKAKNAIIEEDDEEYEAVADDPEIAALFLEEDKIKYEENDDDSDIEFLDENYEKACEVTLGSPSSKLFNTLDPSEIIDSFAVKEDEELDMNNYETSFNDDEEEEELDEEDEEEDYELNGSKLNIITSKGRIRKFSEFIRNELEKKFVTNNFISGSEKSELATKLNLTERQVQKWFIHRREKLRRMQKKIGVPMLGLRRGNYHSNQQIHNQLNDYVNNNEGEDDEEEEEEEVVKEAVITQKPQQNKKNVRNATVSHRVEENPYKKIYFTKTSHIKYEDVNYEGDEFEDEEDLPFEDECDVDNNAPAVNNLESENVNLVGNQERYRMNEFEEDEEDNFDDYVNENEFDEDGADELPSSNNYDEYKENSEYLSIDDEMGDSKSNEIIDDAYDSHRASYSSLTSQYHHANNPHSNHHHHQQQQQQQQLQQRVKREDAHLAFSSSSPSSTLVMNKHMKCFQSSQRRLFPPQVVEHLEKIFDKQKYVNDTDVQRLIAQTHLNEKQIRSWFKQRRYRFNLENKQNGVTKDFGLQQRIMLPKHIIDELERAFNKNNYISGTDKKNLIRKLDLRPSQIERWFYYRRKKQSKK